MQKSNNKDTKKILTIFVLIVTLMICETGATYAYFAVSATNNNTVTGTAATVNLNLTVSRVTPDTTKWNASTKVMVPQKTTALGTAMNPTNKCVDGNSNVVCEVFQIQITNNSTASVNLRGTIHFTYSGTGATYSNLYWQEVTGANAIGTGKTQFKASTDEATESTTAKAANARLVNNLSLANGASSTYYVVVWIEEIDDNQNSTDKGTWTANVSFKDQLNSNQGVTSTITN